LAKIIALHISLPDKIKHPYNAYQACFQIEIAPGGIICVWKICSADIGPDLLPVCWLRGEPDKARRRPNALLIIGGCRLIWWQALIFAMIDVRLCGKDRICSITQHNVDCEVKLGITSLDQEM
jgi:hypothetical protein